MIFILFGEGKVVELVYRLSKRECREEVRRGVRDPIPSWRWKFISSALVVPPSPLTSSSSNKSREDAQQRQVTISELLARIADTGEG